MIENLTNSPQDTVKKSGKSRRGFASMDRDRHKLVSSKGGKSVRTTYTTHNLTPTPAASASPVN